MRPHWPDRRRRPRARIRATAWIISTTRAAQSAAEDLSAAGILARTQTPFTPGSWVSVRLQVEGLRPVNLRGIIARMGPSDAKGFAVAIDFRDVQPPIDDALQQMVAATSETSKPIPEDWATVLVADASPVARRSLGTELTRIGWHARCAPTTTEAARLLDRTPGLLAAIVGARSAVGDGIDLLALIANRDPQVRRVLLSDDSVEARFTVQSRRAHAVLSVRWTPSDLEEVLR